MPDHTTVNLPTAPAFEAAYGPLGLPFAVTTVALDGAAPEVIYANDAFTRLTGVALPQISGRALYDCCRLADGSDDTLAETLERFGRFCGRLIWTGGTEAMPFETVWILPLYDRSGSRRYWLIVYDRLSTAPGGHSASRGAKSNGLECCDALYHGVVVHRHYRPLYLNPASARRFGFASVEEALQEPSLLPILPVEVHARAMARHERILAGEDPGRSRHMRCLARDGHPFRIESGETLIQWDGAPAVLVSFFDVTGQARLRGTERLLRDAIDKLSDSFILYDSEERVVLTNRRFHEYFPFLPHQDEIIGRPMIDMVRGSVTAGAVTDPTLGEDIEGWIAEFIDARRRNDRTEAEDTWPNGRWDIVKEQHTGSGGFVSVRTDITARKRAEFALRDHEMKLEQALAERTAQLKGILENIAQGVTVADPEQRIVLTNQGFFDLFGYPPEMGRSGTHLSEYIRRRIVEGRLRPEERDTGLGVEELVERRLKQYAEMRREDYQETLPDGRVIEVHRQRLPDDLVVSTFTDVTDRVNAEKELQRQREALYQTEKMTALGALLAGVAHELNNPLSVVIGQAAMLESQITDTELAQRAVKIRSAADRCAKIVKIFLSMARQKPAVRAAIQINHLIEQALDLVSYQLRTADVEIECRLPPDLPEISGDPDQLAQVFVNLFINAQQAMVGIEATRRLLIVSQAIESGDKIEVAVSDSGTGVPEEVRLRIFDPFFTTKPIGVGTGVGLSVCHGMITSHGGTISVSDAPGGGALFKVVLPIAAPGAGEVARETEAEPVSNGGQVLIIDDETEICEFLAELLEREGHKVETAFSGKAALAKLSSNDYAAIICDLRMPYLDGPALYHELGEIKPHLAQRFIFITGDLLNETTDRFLKSTGRPCIEKPLQPEQIRRLVNEVHAISRAK